MCQTQYFFKLILDLQFRTATGKGGRPPRVIYNWGEIKFFCFVWGILPPSPLNPLHCSFKFLFKQTAPPVPKNLGWVAECPTPRFGNFCPPPSVWITHLVAPLILSILEPIFNFHIKNPFCVMFFILINKLNIFWIFELCTKNFLKLQYRFDKWTLIGFSIFIYL